MATWFTVKQVAEYLQLSPSTIYMYAKKGKIPSSCIGKQWRFDKTEIDDWVKKNKKNAK